MLDAVASRPVRERVGEKLLSNAKGALSATR
jgi:hypothetical protein